MLIEDLTITSEIGENFLGNTVHVKSISIAYGVNALSTATISIELSADGSIHYHDFIKYDIAEIVGKTISIKWKDKALEIFTGRISGIQLDKSQASVAYSINCSGGPLAFYNTEMAVKGWYPSGSIDNKLSEQAFQDALFNEATWNSPKTFMAELANKLLVFDKTQLDKTNSQGTKNAANIVKSELETDLKQILEPEILTKVWGHVGEFRAFKEVIIKRMQELVTSSGASFTYWAILLMICEEIGVYIVPWIKNTLVLPHALFSEAPKANVIFPSLIRSINVVTDPFNFPDQIIIPTDLHSIKDLPLIFEQLNENNSIAVPTFDKFENRNSPYQGNRYKVVPAPKYAQFILRYAPIEVQEEVKKNAISDFSQKNLGAEPGNSKITYNIYKDFAKNMGEFLYKKMRSDRNSAQVVCAFQPYMIPGASCYTIDGVGEDGTRAGMNFRGIIWGLSHTITESDAQTTVSLRHTVFPVTEKFEIKSPLWEKLLPTGQNTRGEPIIEELTGQISGFPEGAGKQVPADDAIFRNPAMNDALAAAEYTGRI